MKALQQSKRELIRKYTKGYRGLMALAVILTILAILFDYMMPQVVRFIVDSVLGDKPMAVPEFLRRYLEGLGGRSFLQSHLILCAGAAMAFSVLSAVCNFLRRLSIAKAAEGITCRLRNSLFSHIQRLPYRWHIQNQTGDTIQRCTSDVEVMRNFLSTYAVDMVRTVFLITISLVLMFSMNRRLSMIALCFVPVMILYSGLFYREISKRFRIADETEGRLSASVQENLTGVRVVRAFGREKYEVERFDERNEEFANYWIRLGRLESWYWSLSSFLCNIQVMIIIIAGTIEAVRGSITLGEFLVFVAYNSKLVWPVRSLGRILSEFSKMSVSLDRINEILAVPVEEDDPSGLEPDLHQDIVFDHVSFGYEGSAPVLRDVSFTLPAGTTLGVLGGTGSGKSTMTYLLDRLYDLEDGCGKITIGGVDLKAIRLSYLRKNTGLVLQEPFLFSKTLRENIGATLSDREDMDSIRKSAMIAHVDEAIEEFSDGYETIVGERGVTLSGGQKQRVAIARTLLQKAPIMIFDDSLSAVDTETDALIRKALRENMGSATVILISHRISTLMQADQIIVLEKGQIVQQGTHRQLLEQDGIYRQIYDIQGDMPAGKGAEGHESL